MSGNKKIKTSVHLSQLLSVILVFPNLPFSKTKNNTFNSHVHTERHTETHRHISTETDTQISITKLFKFHYRSFHLLQIKLKPNSIITIVIIIIIIIIIIIAIIVIINSFFFAGKICYLKILKIFFRPKKLIKGN